MRSVLALALLCAVSHAHGGVFRPPPRLKPGDIFQPKRGVPTSTKADGKSKSLVAWEYWWWLNRGRIMRVRDRMIERVVVTGSAKAKDLFDRDAVRARLVPVMVEALRDTEQAVRTSAAVALGKFQARQHAGLLRDVFSKDPIRDVREAALMGLMLMRDPAQLEWLRKLATNDSHPRRVRGMALLGLAFLKDTGFLIAVAGGKRMLPGSNSTVEDLRAAAALGLGLTEDPAAITPLLELVRDKRAPRGARGFAGTALARLGNSVALPDLLDLIRDDDEQEEARYGAAIAVGRLVRPQESAFVDLLGKKAQRDKDRGLRALLLISLGRIGGERAVTHIVAGLPDSEPRLRGFYLLALGLSRHPDAGDLLVEHFGKQKRTLDRAACALALGLAGHTAAAPLIREELAKAHPAFMPHGLAALALLHDRKAIPTVQRILREIREPVVWRDGAVALALLRGTAAVPELLELMRDGKSTMTRGAVAAALGLVGTERAVDPLLERYRLRRLKDEERAVALAALGRIGDPMSVPLLLQFSEDLNPYVICEAVQELLNIL